MAERDVGQGTRGGEISATPRRQWALGSQDLGGGRGKGQQTKVKSKQHSLVVKNTQPRGT